MKKRNILAVLLVSSLSFSVLADDWTFELEPYLMATKIVGDASIGRASGAEVDVDFETIFDNLDMAGMLHFEAHHKSGWGLAVDYAFMDLSAKQVNNRDGFLKVGLRQGVLETLGLYRVSYGKSTVDYFAGVRWWNNDLELVLDPAITNGSTDIKIQEDWFDVVAGVRWKKPVNKNWHFVARADVGEVGHFVYDTITHGPILGLNFSF